MMELDQHEHTGIGTKRLNPKFFLGFPIFTATPTHNAEEGTILLANESGTYKLYAFINGGWSGVTLT